MWDIWGFTSTITGNDAVRSDEFDVVGTEDSGDSVRPTFAEVVSSETTRHEGAVHPTKRGKPP